MNSRPNLLLLSSAIVYGCAAIPLLFAPEELSEYFGMPASVGQVVLLQVLGSAVFGFSMLNWANRFSRLGGVLGRPIVMANLAHAGTAFLLLVRAATRTPDSLAVVLPTVAYFALAVAFGSGLFFPPRESA